MNILKKVYYTVKEFIIRYPAVLSGYIIYGYLFITMMDYFVKGKRAHVAFHDLFEVFDALPWMWLLSWALVKIINYRSKLHETEKGHLLAQQEIEIKQTQLKTMHEVVRGLQHEINNPLSVMTLYIPRAKKLATRDEQQLKMLEEIEKSTQRISKAMSNFAKAQQYEVDSLQVIGDIARPPKSP